MKREVLKKEQELIEKLRDVLIELSENEKELRKGRYAGYWKNLQAELKGSMRRTFRIEKKAILSPVKKAQPIKKQAEPQPEEDEAPRMILADNSPTGEKETKRRISRKRRTKKNDTDNNK